MREIVRVEKPGCVMENGARRASSWDGEVWFLSDKLRLRMHHNASEEQALAWVLRGVWPAPQAILDYMNALEKATWERFEMAEPKRDVDVFWDIDRSGKEGKDASVVAIHRVKDRFGPHSEGMPVIVESSFAAARGLGVHFAVSPEWLESPEERLAKKRERERAARNRADFDRMIRHAQDAAERWVSWMRWTYAFAIGWGLTALVSPFIMDDEPWKQCGRGLVGLFWLACAVVGMAMEKKQMARARALLVVRDEDFADVEIRRRLGLSVGRFYDVDV